MRQISLKVPDDKLNVSLDLMNSLGYVRELHSTDFEDAKILEDIAAAIDEVKKIKAGKLDGIPAKGLFSEL